MTHMLTTKANQIKGRSITATLAVLLLALTHSQAIAQQADRCTLAGAEQRRVGNMVTIDERVTWSAPECGAVFHLIKTTRSSGKFGGQSTAVIAKPATPATTEDILQ